jgi:putative flippase GtrA
MISLVKRFFQIRIIRYGLVGGIGIPIQDAASFLFVRLLGQSLFPLADAFAFLISNFINFTLNQFFTYKEQVQGIHGWEWIRRFFKGQLTSLSASLIAYLIALGLVYFAHVNDFIANPIGIVIAFLYNFFVSNKLVFRPTASSATPTATDNLKTLAVNSEQEAEPTPK